MTLLFSPWLMRRCIYRLEARRTFSSTYPKYGAAISPVPPEDSKSAAENSNASSSSITEDQNDDEEPKKKLKFAEREDKDLQYLSRPLGVRERPSATAQKDNLWDLVRDDEKRMSQRKELFRQVATGYYQDMHDTRKEHRGKTWIGPKVLIREDKALYFPNIAGKTLDTNTKRNTTTICFGKISLVSMLGTKISEVHAESFTKPTHASFKDHPLYQHVLINLQENVLKNWLVALFTRSLREQVPPSLHSTYLLSSQDMMYLREPMGLTNSKIGYVYLVDENLKIRWAGGGAAISEEVSSLHRCTEVLLKRTEQRRAQQRTSGQKSI